MFRNQLETALKNLRDKYEDDKKLSAAEVLHIVADFADVLSSILRAIGNDGSQFNQLVEDTEWVFDTYLRPIDFPVNNILENWLENQAKGLVRPLLESLRSSLEPK